MTTPSRSFLPPSRRSLAAGVVALLGLVAASSAGARPAPGRWQTFVYGSGPSAHPYIVYTPRGYRVTGRIPLVVMLHGCQTTAYQQMKANLYNHLADRRHFVVVYPDVDSTEAAQPGVLRDCWNFFSPDEAIRGKGDGPAVAGITRTVMSRWQVDRTRVYLMGMSAGSFLTADMAAAYPELYAAVGENAGGAYADSECLFANTRGSLSVSASAQAAYVEMGRQARIVPKLVIGGDRDTGVPPACADKSVEQSLRTDNLVIDHGRDQTGPISLTPASTRSLRVPHGHAYTVSVYRGRRGCPIAERYLVHGMEHFWSGGSPDPRWASFTDPKGPSAAVASWAFFSHFALSDRSQPAPRCS